MVKKLCGAMLSASVGLMVCSTLNADWGVRSAGAKIQGEIGRVGAYSRRIQTVGSYYTVPAPAPAAADGQTYRSF